MVSNNLGGLDSSYATVYTQSGRSFKVTPSGSTVGSKGINVFKRRSGEGKLLLILLDNKCYFSISWN